MRIAYVTRSFLDYRIPVFESLDERLNGDFSLFYSANAVPTRCQMRLAKTIGNRAVGLTKEWVIGDKDSAGFANQSWRFTYQPGLFRKLRDFQPDVIVATGLAKWTCQALLYRVKYPVALVIAYERTAYTERSAQRIRTTYRKAALRLVDAMAVNGRMTRDYSICLGMDPARIVTGQMAADTHFLGSQMTKVTNTDRSEIRRGWACSDIAFLTVGGLHPRKGFRELLIGWRLLQERRPGPWTLVIVGDGPQRKELVSLTKSLDLHNVIFVGHVDYKEIAAHYTAADAFISSTLEDNWSLVVPEAMACGLPILCSRYNGCYPELVQDGVNGTVFDPLKPEDILNRPGYSGDPFV